MERGLAQMPVIMGVSYVLRDDSRNCLHVADSYTGNHPKDDCTPLETIQRSHGTIGKRITFELEGEAFKPKWRVRHQAPQSNVMYASMNAFLLTSRIKTKSWATIEDPYRRTVCIELLLLTEFFCEVLEYFKVHISRLNPFGGAKLTTFIVMCKAYGCEPTVELFQGFINLCRGEIAFRNFVYAEDEEDLSFLPKEPSPSFGIGFSSVSVNIEPLRANEELVLQPAEVTTDSGGIPKPELFVVHPGSVAARIKDRKFKTRRGSSRPPVKRKLASGSSNSRATRTKTSTSTDDVLFLTVSDDDEGKLLPFEFFSIVFAASEVHPVFAVVDNAVNRRSHELLEVIEKLRGECDVIKDRERAREEEFESLQVKCKAVMSDFEKNPTVISLRENISTLSTEVKEHKANLEMMMLESQKWASYQANLSTLESHIASLEAKKARLEAVEVSLRKEVDDVKRDRMEVVSKVVPYATMELIHNDDLALRLVKVKSYRPSYKKEHDQAGNDLSTATFSWLSEFVADPSAPVEVLLSKKPPSL
ncbi:hypothetical protein Tco_0221379 [Tanacetum coccineum]